MPRSDAFALAVTHAGAGNLAAAVHDRPQPLGALTTSIPRTGAAQIDSDHVSGPMRNIVVATSAGYLAPGAPHGLGLEMAQEFGKLP